MIRLWSPRWEREWSRLVGFTRQLRGVFAQVCGLGPRPGEREASGLLAVAAKGGFSAWPGRARGGEAAQRACWAPCHFQLCLVNLGVLFRRVILALYLETVREFGQEFGLPAAVGG